MTQEQQTVFFIKGMIARMPADQQEACHELCDHIRRVVKEAGDIGPVALVLVGAEAAAE